MDAGALGGQSYSMAIGGWFAENFGTGRPLNDLAGSRAPSAQGVEGGSDMSQYTAIVTREGKWWMVRVPEIGGLTQARRLGEAGLMARELIAVSKDIPLEDVRVEVRLASVGGLSHVAERVAGIASHREQAAELERQATRDAVALAKALSERDIPVRDVGAILGVSHQRAHQLLRG